MGILVEAALGVLVLEVVALDFAAVEDDLGSLLDAVGRVGRVAVRGGMRRKWSASRVRVWPCLVTSVPLEINV
jgi:hypothetical protein